MKHINDATYVMCLYSVILVVMQEAAPSLKVKGKCFATSVREYFQTCRMSRRLKL